MESYGDGYSLKYDWQYQGLKTVTIATHEIGELVLTSGQILGGDPAHHDGEVIWISKRRTRSAFGTTATPRPRLDFMPSPFPIHPGTRCTRRRAISPRRG